MSRESYGDALRHCGRQAGTEAGPEEADVAARGAPPVFVHSSWRSGSTWLWDKLRQAPTTLAYCEIFHERLQCCLFADLRREDFDAWNSRHPQGAPYFLEFAPLIAPDGATRGYDRSMATERFIPGDGIGGALSAEERSYLELLIRNAGDRGKIPVLCDVRSLGRFAAIADSFGGAQVLLVRNLFHQWGSYTEQFVNGNHYFIDMLFETVERSRSEPIARILWDWFAADDRSPANPRVFQLFLLFHLFLYAHAFDAATCVVDINKIARDAECRRLVESKLSSYVRFPIDLSDARAPFCLSQFCINSRTAFVEEIEQFVKLIIDGSISEAAAQFVLEQKDRALEEWDRNEYYVGCYRSVAVNQAKIAEARIAEIEAEREEARRLAEAAIQEREEARRLAEAATEERREIEGRLAKIAARRPRGLLRFFRRRA